MYRQTHKHIITHTHTHTPTISPGCSAKKCLHIVLNVWTWSLVGAAPYLKITKTSNNYLNLFVYQPIYLSIYLPICLSIYLCNPHPLNATLHSIFDIIIHHHLSIQPLIRFKTHFIVDPSTH